jgi:hypothetical protein
MQKPMKFDDAKDFAQELEQKLKADAQKRGRSQDYVNLKEELAIERFVARIPTDIAIVKGGAAAMFTIKSTPHTKDVDIIIPTSIVTSLGLDKMEPMERADAIADLIQEHATTNTNDFFRFKFENSRAITGLKPGHACARIEYTVMVGGTELTFIQVDIALQHGDVPSELTDGRDLLAFADVANPKVRIATPEYLLADKLTLYLEEHGKPDADRVKDIVHAALIIQNCSPNMEQLTECLAERAFHREVLDKLKLEFPDPPDHWQDRFEELIKQADAEMRIDEALAVIRETLKSVRTKAYNLAKDEFLK